MIAYTLGHAESYDRAIALVDAAGVRSHKLTGGSVWRTGAEAADRVRAVSGPDFAVYTVEIVGTWEESTDPVDGETWSRLLVDAVIVGRWQP